jgi:hypothetical protein
VAGVHGLQHVERFLATALAEDDTVGPHAQRVLDEVALLQLAVAFDVGRARFHAGDVGLLQLQLSGVLDGNQPLVLRNESRQRVEHGRLAGARAARDDGRLAGVDGGRQHLGHVLGDRAELDQPVQPELVLGKLADRDQRPIDRDRPDRGVEARAVEHARIDHRLRFIDAAADRGDDLVDDPEKVRLVLEGDVHALQLALLLDVAVLVSVDQDVVDVRVLEQWLKRTEADHLVDDIFDQCIELGDVDRHALFTGLFRNEFMDLPPHLVLGEAFQRNQIDLFDQHAMDADTCVEHAVAGLLSGGGFGRRRHNRLARIGYRDAVIGGAWLLDRLRRSVGAFLERRKAAVHDAFLKRPLPSENSERDFCAVASTSSGSMIFFKSLITLASGSISCNGTPRSTAWRTSR